MVSNLIIGQNSMVGDGFGGRLWYTPTNYGVASYSAYTICSDSIPNQLYTWGSNSKGTLGFGPTLTGSNVPIPIPNMNNIKYYSGGYFMGAIKNDNTGWAWGLSVPTTPVQVLTDAYFVDASSKTISFVKNDGTVWSIGENINGQLGDATIINAPLLPVQMQGITNAVRVSNNRLATIILLSDSTLMAVGLAPYSGIPSVPQTSVPLPITGIPKIIDIQSNAAKTIALSDSGFVYTWGAAPPFGNSIPEIITGLNNIVAISACDDGLHFMALDENKNCFVWGLNTGQTGVSTSMTMITNPVLIETNVVDIMAGESFSYLVKSDGSLWASGQSWGSSSLGMSIWLNLTDTLRPYWSQLDLNQVPNACEVVVSIKSDQINTPILKVYPNPTSSHITIEGLIKPYNLTIYNSLGQLLYKENDVLENTKRLDISGYSKGLIFIRIESDGEFFTHKILKK